MTRYIKREDYEVMYINSNDDILRLACCDCGMVHTIGVLMRGNKHERLAKAKLKKYEVGMVFVSEPRCTAQLRRYNYGHLQNPIKKDKYKLNRR